MREFQVPIFTDLPLRMPSNAKEARIVTQRFWSTPMGGRAYLYADVFLDKGEYLRHVEFDGSGLAIRVGMNTQTADCPELFGRHVIRWCPIRSFSEGQIYDWATASERMRFARHPRERITICGLHVPRLLLLLIETERWTHPGDDVIKEMIPFLDEPIDFLTLDQMEFESSGHLADNPDSSSVFHEMRGSETVHVPDLPWRDVSKSFFVAVNRNIGDDLGLALDFRDSDETDPRVIANDWGEGGCKWREVSPAFSDFVARIGL